MITNLRKLVFLLISIYFTQNVLANQNVKISDFTEEIPLQNNHFFIFEDTTNQYTFNQVHSFDFKGFKRDLNLKFAKNHYATYWVKFSIENNSVKNNKWVLEVFSHNIHHLSVYMPNDEGVFNEYKTGQKLDFKNRIYKVINPVFDLPNIKNKPYTVYLKINTQNDASFDFHLRTQHFFTEYATKEYTFFGFYYGIIAFIILYFFILYIYTQEYTYLFYVLYLFSCAITTLVDDGVGFEFLWPNFPDFNEILTNYIASSFFLLSYVFYSIHFVKIKEFSKKSYFLIIFSTIFLIVIQFIESTEEAQIFLYLIPFIIVYITSIKLYFNGQKFLRFFILAQTMLLFSMIIIRSTWVGIIDANIYTVYSFNVCVLLEALLFSYAFVDRFNQLKKENHIAQQNIINELEKNTLLQNKVNIELENKVNERTEALKLESEKLSEANMKLEALMLKVNEMNSKLDYDNWQLNKKVLEETRARITFDFISFQDFLKIYPNEFTCLKYLEELKWKNGFTCKKCGNTKYAYIQKSVSRKCSKCAYIESSTNSTIFQGIKFPIVKAFYIVYLSAMDSNELTIEELSEILELRKNTCWSFRKKVLEVKSNISNSSKIKDKNKFESIILNVFE